jgi:hypothetical protein
MRQGKVFLSKDMKIAYQEVLQERYKQLELKE